MNNKRESFLWNHIGENLRIKLLTNKAFVLIDKIKNFKNSKS